MPAPPGSLTTPRTCPLSPTSPTARTTRLGPGRLRPRRTVACGIVRRRGTPTRRQACPSRRSFFIPPGDALAVLREVEVDARTGHVKSTPAVYAAGFASWTVWTTYAGFAFGFVLLGNQLGADVRDVRGVPLRRVGGDRSAEASYTRLIGWAYAAAMVATTVGIADRRPAVLLRGVPVRGMDEHRRRDRPRGAGPVAAVRAPRSESADELTGRRPIYATRPMSWHRASLAQRYLTTLRAGVREATRPRRTSGTSCSSRRCSWACRRTTSTSDCSPTKPGAATADVAILMAFVTAGQVVGTALADRTESVSRRTHGVGRDAVAGALIAAGAVSGHAPGSPSWRSATASPTNAIVVGEARMQSVISGTARATVTSTVGILLRGLRSRLLRHVCDRLAVAVGRHARRRAVRSAARHRGGGPGVVAGRL